MCCHGLCCCRSLRPVVRERGTSCVCTNANVSAGSYLYRGGVPCGVPHLEARVVGQVAAPCRGACHGSDHSRCIGSAVRPSSAMAVCGFGWGSGEVNVTQSLVPACHQYFAFVGQSWGIFTVCALEARDSSSTRIGSKVLPENKNANRHPEPLCLPGSHLHSRMPTRPPARNPHRARDHTHCTSFLQCMPSHIGSARLGFRGCMHATSRTHGSTKLLDAMRSWSACAPSTAGPTRAGVLCLSPPSARCIREQWATQQPKSRQ